MASSICSVIWLIFFTMQHDCGPTMKFQRFQNLLNLSSSQIVVAVRRGMRRSSRTPSRRRSLIDSIFHLLFLPAIVDVVDVVVTVRQDENHDGD